MKDKSPSPALEVREDGQIYIDGLLVSNQEVARKLAWKAWRKSIGEWVPEKFLPTGIYPIPGLKWEHKRNCKCGEHLCLHAGVAVISIPESDGAKNAHTESLSEPVSISQEQYEELSTKASKWDALAEEMAKFYEEDSEADLGDIGETAAIAFGYL